LKLTIAAPPLVTPLDQRGQSYLSWPTNEIRDRSGGIAFLLAGFAELATAEAQPRRARRLAGAAAALRQKHGTPLAPSLQVRLEHTLELVRSACSGEDAVAAWSEGQAMTLEQAMAYALTVEGETPVADAQQEII
jgi:hypothetical protein